MRRTAKQELANGNGKFLGPKSERVSLKMKGEFGSAKDGIIENGEVNANSNGAEDVDGKKKKRGDVRMRIGEDGTVKEGRDRGKKRRMEVAGDGRDVEDSIERQSKKKIGESPWMLSIFFFTPAI